MKVLLRDHVAIITGGGGALGEAMALEFAREGAALVIGEIDEAAARRVANGVIAAGGKAIPVVADVTDPEQVKGMVDAGVRAFGRIHILVNNAGTTGKKDHRKKTILEMEKSEWERVLAVNLTSVFNCSKCVLPLMIGERHGHILNISSVAAKVGGLINGVHYVAAKAGMIGMTKALAREYARENIRVNALCLGRIETPANLSVPREFHEKLIAQIPLGRLGTPREVAAAAAFMASDASSYITGATLDVNGGWLMD
jgi:3-oxoacyl-[acyl-carrier protein] reductase